MEKKYLDLSEEIAFQFNENILIIEAFIFSQIFPQIVIKYYRYSEFSVLARDGLHEI